MYILTPTSPLPPSILPSILPSSGFLHGLSTSKLPEIYFCDQPPRIRPHVQKNYSASDPFSPLGLVVPRGLVPPWRDVFVEGQRDVVHGGTLMKTVIQNAKLKQCSRCVKSPSTLLKSSLVPLSFLPSSIRCRSWTVASEGLQVKGSSSTSDQPPQTNPVQQWRLSWSHHCLCGSPWMLRSSLRNETSRI